MVVCPKCRDYVIAIIWWPECRCDRCGCRFTAPTPAAEEGER